MTRKEELNITDEDIKIRAIKVEDAEDLNEMRLLPESRHQMLSLSTERITSTRAYIENLTNDDHVLVAEVTREGKKKVVGHAALFVNKQPRLRHCALISLLVHSEYHDCGIGRRLMNALLDLADNWLMLVRLELIVYVDNDKAIELYTKSGFHIEGTRLFDGIRNDVYTNSYLMARYYNLPAHMKVPDLNAKKVA